MSTERAAAEMGAGSRSEHIERACVRWGIDTTERKAHFLGQLAHETKGFTRFSESMNYTVAGLLSTFPRHRISREDAERLGRKPGRAADQPGIANLVYANRYGNGGPETGDGWKYRGQGDKQITFKDNYRACSLALFGDLRLLADPSILTQPEHGPQAAGWFWATNGLNALATSINDEVIERVTRRINGGINGLAGRAARTRQAFAIFRSMTR